MNLIREWSRMFWVWTECQACSSLAATFPADEGVDAPKVRCRADTGAGRRAGSGPGAAEAAASPLMLPVFSTPTPNPPSRLSSNPASPKSGPSSPGTLAGARTFFCQEYFMALIRSPLSFPDGPRTAKGWHQSYSSNAPRQA